MVYRKQGREEEAKKAFAESAELRRRDTDESELRTECAQKLDTGPRAEARAFCQRLYDPDDAERLTALGTIYGQHGDLEAALEPLRRAAELAPGKAPDAVQPGVHVLSDGPLRGGPRADRQGRRAVAGYLPIELLVWRRAGEAG